MTPPRPRAPTPPPNPAHTLTMSDKSFNILQSPSQERQWYRQQTDGTKHLPHHKAPHTDPSRCYAKLPRFSRWSSYPQSTNFSHQLKINTASDPDTRLHLPSSSLRRTSRQASTSGNHLTVQCVWP